MNKNYTNYSSTLLLNRTTRLLKQFIQIFQYSNFNIKLFNIKLLYSIVLNNILIFEFFQVKQRPDRIESTLLAK